MWMTGRDAALLRANDIGFSLLFVPCSKGAAFAGARTNSCQKRSDPIPYPGFPCARAAVANGQPRAISTIQCHSLPFPVKAT